MASVGFQPNIFEFAAQASAAVVTHVGVAVPSRDDIERILRA
jgi:hypothetical protein